MSIRKLQSEFASAFARLVLYAESLGYEVTHGDTNAVNLHLLESYIKDHGFIGNLKRKFRHVFHSRNSNHYKRLAGDLNLFIDGVYQTSTEAHRPLGEWWEKQHPKARWGGNFKSPDGNHYELNE